MSGLPLLSLHSNLLEKVINKTGDRYFLLQLTCSAIDDFIRANRNISIRIFKTITTSWDEEKSCCLLQCSNMVAKNVEMLFGCRVTSISFALSEGNKIEQIEEIWKTLKTNRITCESLDLSNGPASFWTKERCLKMIDTVKAVNVALDSRGSNGFEALLEPKIPLKEIIVRLNVSAIDLVISQFLLKFQNLKIDIDGTPDNSYAVLRSLLEMFFSGPLPNINKLYFVMYSGGNPTKAKIEEELGNYNLTPQDEYPDRRTNVSRFYTVNLPEYFPIDSYCRIIFYPSSVVFEYCSSGVTNFNY